MTEEATIVATATPENQRTGRLEVLNMIKTAGVRERGELLEIAYPGMTPGGFPFYVRLDGVQLRAISAVPQPARGFAVIMCERITE